MEFNFFLIVNSITVFLLSIFVFLLINKGWESLSNKILTFFFIFQLIVFVGFFSPLGFKLSEKFTIYLSYTTIPIWFLWGPTMYFYVKSKIVKDFRLKAFDLLHLVPFLSVLVFLSFQNYFLSYNIRYEIFTKGLINNKLFLLSNFNNVQVFLYNLASLLTLFHYQKRLKNFSSALDRKDIWWLKLVLYGYIITCFSFLVVHYFSTNLGIPYSWQLNITVAVFLIFFNILFYKAIIYPAVILAIEEKPTLQASVMSNIDILNYADKIEEFMKTNKPYINPMLTIKELSESTGISERILSQVINRHFNKNFYAFVNSYRVEEAKKILLKLESDKMTMLAIACDAGFNTKSVFNDAFKKHTGMTPSEYRLKSLN